MTSTQVKRALREMGLAAIIRKAKGGGHDYSLRLGVREIASGWDHGTATDALHSAYGHAVSLRTRQQIGGAQ